jgi:K+-sensing histidine kinase KdpD
VTFEAHVPYRDGGARSIEATYIPQRGEDGVVVGYVGLVTDISERKSFERFRAAAATRAERLLRITAAIAEAVSDDQVYAALVDEIGAAVGASSAGLWLLDDDGGSARLMRAYGYSEAARRSFATITLAGAAAIPAIDALRGEPVWIASQAELLERYPHLAGAVTPGRSYRVRALPLLARGGVLGALAFTIEADQPPDEDERDFLLLAARYASQAVERLRLLHAERRSSAEADAAARRLGLLSRASRAFVESSFDQRARLEVIVNELGAALESCVGVALLDGDGLLRTSAVFHPDAEAGRWLREASPPLRVGEGVTGEVVAGGESVLLRSLDPARVAPAYRAFLERHPAYAMMCAPLRARGQILGAVNATRTRPGESYGDDDLRLLEELAERAAVAIDNSRLYQEILDARTRSEQLYRFAQAVVAADRVEQVFEAALDAIEAALGTDRAAILTFDGDGVMRFRAWRNLSEAYRAAVEGHSPWPADATAPEPVLVGDAAADPALAAYRPLFEREGIGALAFIPLVTRGRLLGKFMVYYAEAHRFTAQEVETARAIANHLASVTTRFSVVAKLEETIRGNELFAGALAHDLRNPLGAIMTAAQLVLMRQEGQGSDRHVKPLTRILTSGQRMTRMIDQLLDFTRARAGGGIEIQPQDANLAELCAQAVGELEVSHPEWRIQLDIAGTLDGAWDPDRLLQVISNLVGNAGQHGRPEEPIAVALDGTRREEVRLAVHNLGAIPPDLLPHIFDPFRGSRHGRFQSRGLGLGLFIVREIVRAHGGRIELASSEADGTTFTLHLPRIPRQPRAS